MNSIQDDLSRFLHLYAAGGSLLLCFDYDGTLAPFAPLPHLATLPPGTRNLLEALAGMPRISVGIISAREMKDLKSMVDLSGLYYCGTAGMEFDLRGTFISHPDADRLGAAMEGLSARLEEGIRSQGGAWVERKGMGFTLHYRDVDPGKVEPLLREARRILEPRAGELRILDGAMALEVTPACGWTKGSALRKIHEHIGGGSAEIGVLYAGDESNDEDGFEAASDLGGISIGVGPRAPSCARHRLGDTAALADLLAGFLEGLKSEGSPPSRTKGGF